MDNILEIALESKRDFRGTRYFTINYSVCANSTFFEGATIDNKRVTPLKEAKIWAKKNGYTHLKVVSYTLSKGDKTYNL